MDDYMRGYMDGKQDLEESNLDWFTTQDIFEMSEVPKSHQDYNYICGYNTGLSGMLPHPKYRNEQKD